MIETMGEAGTRLGPEALRERLRVLGFRDAERASRTLDSLVAGTSRRAKLLRVLSPAMLRFLSSAPLPDEGLIGFLRLAESLQDRVDVLNALRDNPPAIALLAHVLGSGRVLGDLLMHVPEELHSIAARDRPRSVKERDRLVREATASLEWRTPERRLDGLRRFKRRELLEVAVLDLSGNADEAQVGRGVSHIADACLEAALGDAELPFAVIALGKLGGRELNYASDIDVMFVHDGDVQRAEKIAEELLTSIAAVTPEGQAFRVDLGLRPEGKAGALVRSLESCLEYYERWAEAWEHLALTKARVAAGDASLGEAFVEATHRFSRPEKLRAEVVAGIRHVKARMERERLGRGVDARRNLKLGPGGMSDVEFSVGMVQLEHAFEHPEIGVTNTSEAIDAASARGLIAAEDAARLLDAYRFCTRLRNRLHLLTGRTAEVLPTKPETLESLGVALGFRDQPRQELEERYLRVTRRARRVAERLIYG
jgi:glutamate-ammonia-ligase adenylyltransferase